MAPLIQQWRYRVDRENVGLFFRQEMPLKLHPLIKTVFALEKKIILSASKVGLCQSDSTKFWGIPHMYKNSMPHCTLDKQTCQNGGVNFERKTAREKISIGSFVTGLKLFRPDSGEIEVKPGVFRIQTRNGASHKVLREEIFFQGIL